MLNDTQPAPTGLGSVVIELNLDTGKMGLLFTNPSSARFLAKEEIPLLFSPMIAGLIIHLLQARSKSIIVA